MVEKCTFTKKMDDKIYKKFPKSICVYVNKQCVIKQFDWNISIKLLGNIWNMLGIWSKHEHDQQQIQINCKEQTWAHNRTWNNANGNEMLQQQRWCKNLQMRCYANTLLQHLWAHGKMVSLKVMDLRNEKTCLRKNIPKFKLLGSIWNIKSTFLHIIGKFKVLTLTRFGNKNQGGK